MGGACRKPIGNDQRAAAVPAATRPFPAHPPSAPSKVGMAVAIMRGAAPPSCLAAALDPDRDFNVPMAPELGLFLVGRPAG